MIYETLDKIGHKVERGDDPKITIYPPKVEDPEGDRPEIEFIGTHWHKKFPPPKKNPEFRRKWAMFLDIIAKREDFNDGHLFQLEILCDLYAEYYDLGKLLRIEGRTYETVGRQGRQIKIRPEVTRVDKVLNQIQAYSKGLSLSISKKNVDGKGANEEEWD